MAGTTGADKTLAGRTLFAEWLSRKTWQQAVRFCRVIVWLLPLAAVAVDAPRLRQDAPPAAAFWWQLASQLAIEIACLAVLWADRFSPRWRGSEAAVNLVAVAILVLATSLGIADWLLQQDLSMYALGMTIAAAVACTPRRIRRPLYLASLLVMLVVLHRYSADLAGWLAAAVNPVCVTLICLELDKYTYQRHLELFDEQQRAEAEQHRADTVLHNALPAPIAEELKRAGRVEARKHEEMGVLFADLAGFTAYSRGLPPDALVLVLNQVFSAFDALVERHGLEKIKTIGDAYMVVELSGSERLARFALDLLQALERYNRANGTRLEIRIGLHCGPAVAGVIGVKRFLYDVWGDTVNLASRLESSGAPGAIHASAAVQRRLVQRFDFQAREPMELKGCGQVQSYWLQASAA